MAGGPMLLFSPQRLASFVYQMGLNQ